MKTTSLFFTALALIATSEAAVFELFAETGCRGTRAERNVFDNTCAPLGGFQSLRQIVAGGPQQFIQVHSENRCVLTTINRQFCTNFQNGRQDLNIPGDATGCVDVISGVGGGSNAISSNANAGNCAN